MKIKIEKWSISSSGRSVNIFTEDVKYYMPLKKIGVTSNDIVPDFDGAVIELEPDDIFVSEEMKNWVRINRFTLITFKNKKTLSWDESNKIKKDVFGKKEKSDVKYEYIDPTKF